MYRLINLDKLMLFINDFGIFGHHLRDRVRSCFSLPRWIDSHLEAKGPWFWLQKISLRRGANPEKGHMPFQVSEWIKIIHQPPNSRNHRVFSINYLLGWWVTWQRVTEFTKRYIQHTSIYKLHYRLKEEHANTGHTKVNDRRIPCCRNQS